MPLRLEPLEPLGGLEMLDSLAGGSNGQPMLLPIQSIDEDPDQPRHEFDAEALQQLADTIAERGVRQPVSVRPNPSQPGRWMLNFGSRRLRASKLAGKTEIAAFVDATADSYDQVIENEQREGLKPLELALFVQRRMAQGDSQADIARKMGKSRTYITYASALIDASDWLLAAYRDGRCQGMSELYELRKLHSANPQYVETWASDRVPITRERVRALGAQFNETQGSMQSSESKMTPKLGAGREPLIPEGDLQPERNARLAGVMQPLVLQARLDGAVVSVIVDRAPDTAGNVFVRTSEGAAVQAVEASRLTLVGFAGA